MVVEASGRSRAVRWAIWGTGAAARSFVEGLRHVDGARPTIVLSRSRERAEHFAHRFGIDRVATAPDALGADVDAVYLATPPGHHRDGAVACLDAGRPVLVEKPFALDAEEAEAIRRAAGDAGVFCMEAMWTRFVPAVGRLKAMVDEGALGEVHQVTADFSTRHSFLAGSHRLDAAAGGGALLDRGVYGLSLAVHLLGAPGSVTSHGLHGPTGVDDQVTVVLGWGEAQARVTAGFRTEGSNDLVVGGSRAWARLHPPIHRPSRLTVRPVPDGGATPGGWRDSLGGRRTAHWALQRLRGVIGEGGGRLVPYRGNGYGHEAAHVQQCLADGRVESPVMPLADSVLVMQLADAARRSWASPARVPAQ